MTAAIGAHQLASSRSGLGSAKDGGDPVLYFRVCVGVGGGETVTRALGHSPLRIPGNCRNDLLRNGGSSKLS